MNHVGARHQVNRLFTAGLPARRHRRLREHLRECDGCRRYYEGVRAVEDAMFAEPAALNDAAVARLADLAVERPRAAKRSAPVWLALFAASATAAAALLFTVGPRETTEEFTARGVAETAGAGLTVFHIDREARTVNRIARQPAGTVLPAGAVVQLGVTTNDELTHLAVLGVDENARVQWYQTPTTLSAGVVDEVIGAAWKLGGGRVRIFAVFSSEALDRAVLEAAAARLRGTELATSDRLPGILAHQDSILIEVAR